MGGGYVRRVNSVLALVSQASESGVLVSEPGLFPKQGACEWGGWGFRRKGGP